MANYNLTRAKANAKKIGYTVKPSKNPKKKLDVFNKDGKKVASIGDATREDFTKHRDQQRRKAFKSRFERFRHKKGTPAFFSDRILWD